MGPGPDGALVPLDLRELGVHLPFIQRLPIGLTVATLTEPLDSSAIRTSDWLRIADAIVDHAPGHAGVVVLHGTDTMAYTASALSFLLDGIDIPIVLTGAQRSVTELRSDGRENLVTALAIAAGHLAGAHLVPEVTIFFDDVLLHGNRAVKVHANSYQGFASPNFPPLATAGVTIDFASTLTRSAGTGPMHRPGGICDAVSGLRLHPGIDDHVLKAVLDRPGLRGLIIEAYGAGNGPPGAWFLEPLRAAVDSGCHRCRDHAVPGRQRQRWALRHGFRAAGNGSSPRRRYDLRGGADQVDGPCRPSRTRRCSPADASKRGRRAHRVTSVLSTDGAARNRAHDGGTLVPTIDVPRSGSSHDSLCRRIVSQKQRIRERPPFWFTTRLIMRRIVSQNRSAPQSALQPARRPESWSGPHPNKPCRRGSVPHPPTFDVTSRASASWIWRRPVCSQAAAGDTRIRDGRAGRLELLQRRDRRTGPCRASPHTTSPSS